MNPDGVVLPLTVLTPAEELVDSVDRKRADLIQNYFKVDWPDRAIYHTMLNTAAMRLW